MRSWRYLRLLNSELNGLTPSESTCISPQAEAWERVESVLAELHSAAGAAQAVVAEFEAWESRHRPCAPEGGGVASERVSSWQRCVRTSVIVLVVLGVFWIVSVAFEDRTSSQRDSDVDVAGCGCEVDSA